MLDDLAVILFRPKYPENIGSTARACLNMGVTNLIIVDPLNFDMDKAIPLATASARHVLENARVVETLAEAIEGFTAVYGTTARTGGWRKGVKTPETLAVSVGERLRAGGRVAIVFGPENIGLTNEETSICTGLLTIPTSGEKTSLNLSQAVVIVLYECFKKSLDTPFVPGGPPDERPTTVTEHEILFNNLQDTLLVIDYLKDKSADYWMLPVRRLFAKIDLRRNEFNILMGICRQIQWYVRTYGPGKK
ncbi:MAG: RNA methyltransferase [Pseudodesulfovibrio sp.]